jgi:predicted negative regulator of RcsB-dependent stress response
MPVQTIDSDSGELSFLDWIQQNSRLVGIGAAIVVVAAAGYWFYLRSAEIKRQNAERGLNQAKQSIAAGNPALAQTDLERVASRYKGTPSGSQAAMLLAQLQYDQGKFAEGLKVLEPYQTSGASGAALPAVWSLTGDGLMSSPEPGSIDRAADAYRKAAEATAFGGERAVYDAKHARALMASGKNAEAKAIWERLVSDPDALSVRNEAQMRLGELTAAPAGRS